MPKNIFVGRVKNSFPTHGRLVSGFFALLLLTFVFSDQVLAQIQIVACNAPVQSPKRGIACNTMTAADFEAIAPGVSWYYNWGATPLTVPAGVNIQFIPMAWNGASSFQTQISSYLAAGNRPSVVFALNEPNLEGQAFMTPSNSAITFEQVNAICSNYDIPVIAPHMAEGSAADQSITAYDPIEMSNVTYTYETPYLAAFEYYCGSTVPAGMSDHSYGGYGDLAYWIGQMHADYPTQTVWVTEFNGSGDGQTNDDATVIANMIPSVDYLERTPWIQGYSWFMSQISGDPHNSILSTTNGVLTAAGQVYVQMPVHETNLFYSIPGQLQACRYVTETNMTIAPTTDTSGLADMVWGGAGATLDYNISVASPGNYTLNFRVYSVGAIDIYEGGTLLGSVTPTQAGWSTVSSTTITLPAGTQTLHLAFLATKDTERLNWIQFVDDNLPPVLAAISNQTVLAGVTLLVTNSASDPNVPPLPLTFSLSSQPAGSSIDPNSGIFSWRPAIAQSPSTQEVAVVVADNGAPPLTATQSFDVTVLQPASPTINGASISNGQFGFWINGDMGPDYIVQESTDLISWSSISVSYSPALPYFWVDTNSIAYPSLFYRVLLGP